MRKLLLGIGLLVGLIPAAAEATNRVWVSEFGVLAAATSGGMVVAAQTAQIPTLADSGPIDITAGSTNYTVGAKTSLVRICVDTQTAVRGAAGATTSNMPLFAGNCEYFGVLNSATISFILAP